MVGHFQSPDRIKTARFSRKLTHEATYSFVQMCMYHNVCSLKSTYGATPRDLFKGQVAIRRGHYIGADGRDEVRWNSKPLPEFWQVSVLTTEQPELAKAC